MSFDVFVQDLPSDARTVADIPEGYVPRPIGRRADIIASILRVAPTTDFTNPTWGLIDGADFSIEVNIGHEEVLESFAFHIRGGQEGLLIVAAILQHLGLRALCPTASGFFDLAELGPTFSQWRRFREQILGVEL
ncbi:MAG: hypothetical protein ACRC8S_17610 [Fimbriiglobus sp.]